MSEQKTMVEVGCDSSSSATLPLDSRDPDILRAALVRESIERRRNECLAKIQTDVVKIAVDLLVREPDIDGFFRALLKTLAEEGESHKVGVWLIDDDRQGCDVWMVHLGDKVITAESPEWQTAKFPRRLMAEHLFTYTQGWHQTIEYTCDDQRLPEELRSFVSREGLTTTVVTPLVLSGSNLGWLTLCAVETPECPGQWWRIALIEAMARQAALALHHSRLVELNRIEERRKAILDERNRLARDIHDTLAQGFGAILMQLQAAQREACVLSPAAAVSIETAIDLARTHMVQARRSVGALRPNVSGEEDLVRTIKRIAELGRRTANVPIDLHLDDLPRFGDGVEREVAGIVQEALTNALRHARARRITIRASTVNSLGLRLSVADDGRGFTQGHSSSGFGMTSMQERAERIGASLTIVTAPRSGTEVVLAWEPLPIQVHAIS
ncbi:MAG TPA: GAF domain-containing sensor histidine kinase [Vicinamibacterales bacterium]|jgi:signal transduction histidine kinase|nr:GAF domain-containing sensor histidine kinase [Vicinamibacterales bacterium]